MMSWVCLFVYVKWARKLRRSNALCTMGEWAWEGCRPGCGTMTEKSIESRSSRGGVPVFRRPNSNPRSRMQSGKMFCGGFAGTPGWKVVQAYVE
jgi:hypothetical protein